MRGAAGSRLHIGTAWGLAFGSCHALSFDRSYANLGIVGKPLTSSTTLQAGAEAHDATAGRHEPRKQTKQGRSKSALKVLQTQTCLESSVRAHEASFPRAQHPALR